MSYFQQDKHCGVHHPKWINLVEFIHLNWEPMRWNMLDRLEFAVEAKALAVFSIARRLITSAEELGQNQWKKKFIGTMMMLFPMIELIGHSRIGLASAGDDQFESNLGAGIELLLDPAIISHSRAKDSLKNDHRRLDKLAHYMDEHSDGPQISDIFFIRNYFLHGLKSHHDQHSSMEDMMNYELPKAIVPRANFCLKTYWKQLKEDDGNQEWLQRLADADIEPFIIQGSELFDAGLIDPNIVSYLEN
jgi:hypothetical protein